jgi:hypothetical protein
MPVLGYQIEHNSLDWGGTFPRSHVFYHTSDNPNGDVFILKPKQQPVLQKNKRKSDETIPAPVLKQRRFQPYVQDGSEELSGHTGPGVPQSPSERKSGLQGHGTATSMTPLP